MKPLVYPGKFQALLKSFKHTMAECVARCRTLWLRRRKRARVQLNLLPRSADEKLPLQKYSPAVFVAGIQVPRELHRSIKQADELYNRFVPARVSVGLQQPLKTISALRAQFFPTSATVAWPEQLNGKNLAAVAPAVLVSFAMLASGATGYYWRGVADPQPILTEIPANFSAADQPVWSDQAYAGDIQVSVEELGRLRAEVVRLRALFSRLADVAQLQDSEFDVDLDIEDSGFFEPLTSDQQQSGIEINGSELKLVNEALYKLDKRSDMVARFFEERRMVFDQTLSGRPVADGQLTSRYGYRADPIHGQSNLHRGVDFVADVGTPILAMADGIVVYAGRNGAYGNLVELQHVNGYRTRYAHNESVKVQRGQRVGKGEQIATLGSTGRSTGPHVHLEVHLDGRHVDPMLFVR